VWSLRTTEGDPLELVPGGFRRVLALHGRNCSPPM
jgi:hypothetical protein